ncbi:DUF3460 family protein [Pseudogulbenkiania subflava]|uniref:DUF3460 family protein n=1 Tax=Pseudogulbenkiania subflava DSM 22618 TaxID=1123014 RepID=A0A1Y6C965_9NEIS|nr:DUF3460 family protein [Pseudogulbenkiania subflava]SMF43234.1 Protein of unknown function [Pseudogulbenkiania subflava DSM 22618]
MIAPREQYRVGHSGYVSPFTEFMDGFLAEHPEVVEDQHHGWYLFWDHKADFEEWKEARTDSVPVKGYDYF